jgi:predicted ATPase/signal transduction histidine kinase
VHPHEDEQLMLDLPGYRIIDERRDGRRHTYGAHDERDGRSVVLEVLDRTTASLAEIARFRQELEILRGFEHEGVARPLAIESHDGTLVLVREDCGGLSLEAVLAARSLPLETSLHVGVMVARTLDALHRVPILHKDIQPANILLNLDTGTVKLTGFGRASRLPWEYPPPRSPVYPEQQLAYISPEQAGRTLRVLDRRSDLYSLGVTLYRLLAGRLPFAAEDPVELIHAHLTIHPPSPAELDPSIPEPVSAVVMKLLHKSAEDRYQSAAGLVADLESCLADLRQGGEIADFLAGRADRREWLAISRSLYGRDSERDALVEAFARTSGGSAEVVFIHGESGMGKTALVYELHEPVVHQRGNFVIGKFERFKQEVPYSALAQAFRMLLQQVQREGAEQRAFVAQRLRETLGTSGRILFEVIPELAELVGELPAIPALTPTASLHRFHRAFRQLTRFFAQPEHPLVLFLDDMHWADSASLRLVHNLVTDPECKYLLVLGAYRDSAVTDTHPLATAIAELRGQGARVTSVAVQPLSRVDVGQMVCDSLLSPGSAPSASIYARIEELVGLVHEKTRGNPLHVLHLLACLYDDGLLRYEVNDDAWTWSVAAIRASGHGDRDVVELVARRLRALPGPTQVLLRQAACLGASFDLALLSAAVGSPAASVARQIWEALRTDLLLPLDDAYQIPLMLEPEDHDEEAILALGIRYRFAHDRVQRAVYYLHAEPPEAEVHLDLGRRLLDTLSEPARDTYLFAIATQLDLGREALGDPSAREDVAEVHFQAAQRARRIGAYELGLTYTASAMELLGDGAWFHRHDLMLALYMEAIADAQAVGNLERADKLVQIALRYAQNPLEQAAILAHQIESLVARGATQQAIEAALHALQLLDVPLRLDPPDGLTPETLLAHVMSDPGLEQTRPTLGNRRLLADQILAAAWRAHHSMSHETVGPVLYTRLHLCAEGATPRMVADTAAQFAVLLCGPLNDIERGYRFGKLALELVERLGIEEARPNAIKSFFARVHHWMAPLHESIAPLRTSIRLGLDHGDPLAACRGALAYCMHLFFLGEHLASVEEQAVRYGELAENLSLSEYMTVLDLLRLRLRSMMGSERRGFEVMTEARSERERTAAALAAFERVTAPSLLFFGNFYEVMHAYLFGDLARALERAQEAAQHATGVTGHFVVAEHNCFYSLTLLALCEDADEARRGEYLNQIAANQSQMAIWAHHAPANFQFRYDLIAAEQARVLGQYEEAIELFDAAIRGAAERSAIHFEALSLERMAALQRAIGDAQSAEEYARDAHAAYMRWGAQSKAQALSARYEIDHRDPWSEAPVTVVDEPDLTVPHVLPIIMSRDVTQRVTAEPDLASILTASQSISREIEIEQVLARCIEAMVAHTDAHRGVIALWEEERLVVAGAWEDDDVRVQPGPAVQSVDVAEQRVWPELLLQVARTRKRVVMTDASVDAQFRNTAYARMYVPQSVMCLPLVEGDELFGVVALEDDRRAGAFTEDRVEAARILAGQTMISIANARAVAQRLAQAEERMRKEREAQNEALAKEAWALAKLSVDKEKFLSLMSHDLKNALNQIVGMTDVMMGELEDMEPEDFDPDEFKVMLEKLGQTAEGCTDLLINLLTWSRLQSGGMALKPEIRDLQALAEKTVKLLDHTASRKDISLENAVARETWINADPNMVDTIVRNLVGNSLKFTPRGGRVIISARPLRPGEGPPAHRARTENDAPSSGLHARASTNAGAAGMIAVSVRDTGVGIKPEDLGKLFRTDVHHTTKGTANEKGSGFGLTMCQEMVRQNGGEIWVESELGKGTTFIFTVPVGVQPEATADASASGVPRLQPA